MNFSHAYFTTRPSPCQEWRQFKSEESTRLGEGGESAVGTTLVTKIYLW